MKQWITIALLLFLGLGISEICSADQQIVSRRVNIGPEIDGKNTDAYWDNIAGIQTRDRVADIDLHLKSVHTPEKIYFWVRYCDPTESRLHKLWLWNPQSRIYKQGPEREDVFVFKWLMTEAVEDFSLLSDQAYTADIWFWKARRTDPVGYADDKLQRLNFSKGPKSQPLIAASGKTMFLERVADKGLSAYKDLMYLDYTADRMARYENRTPSESRADIRVKGAWSDNYWTIEFSRALNTGNPDDVQFDLSRTYVFGVSRYEIAGREPDPRMDAPLYGSGDISEKLTLIFDQ